MKPCAHNRQRIAWLTLDALPPQEAQELRAHIQSCEACRSYLAELSNLTQTLRTAEITPDIQTSESFHRKVAAAIRAQESKSVWVTLAAFLPHTRLQWRIALPALATFAAMILGVSTLLRHPTTPLATSPPAHATLVPNPKKELSPTIANYHIVAYRSLEHFDDLLTRQAVRNPSPSPVYTASIRSLASAPD